MTDKFLKKLSDTAFDLIDHFAKFENFEITQAQMARYTKETGIKIQLPTDPINFQKTLSFIYSAIFCRHIFEKAKKQNIDIFKDETLAMQALLIVINRLIYDYGFSKRPIKYKTENEASKKAKKKLENIKGFDIFPLRFPFAGPFIDD